jgi:molybdopterin-guanine dinucleotide biosynthesis protein A
MRSQKLPGAVLAGGRGRRMGGDKARAMLGDRPLLAAPVRALSAVCAPVAIVAKPATRLPQLAVAVVREPAEPFHPAAGIVAALRWAAGASVLIAAGDLPFIERGDLEALLAAGGLAIAQAPRSGPQPLLGVYPPGVADALAQAARAGAPLRGTVLGLGARIVAVSERTLVNVNTPQELAAIRT